MFVKTAVFNDARSMGVPPMARQQHGDSILVTWLGLMHGQNHAFCSGHGHMGETPMLRWAANAAVMFDTF